MRNRIKYLIVLMLSVYILSGCTTYKHYGYFQDIESIELGHFSDKYEAKIKKDDRLRIIVFGADAKVVSPYNLTIGDQGASNITQTGTGLSYLVDKNGDITFPTLGDIHVEGMTRRELEKQLTERIGQDVKNPTVLVSFENYTITILGDVGSPGEKKIDSERISIFKALSLAGDVNMNARHDNVLLIREVDGKPTYHRLDLRTAKTLSSEYYYLQQNDIVYVQPGPISDTNRTVSFWSSIIGAVSTVTTMILLLIK